MQEPSLTLTLTLTLSLRQERVLREYEEQEAREGGRKTLPVQLPSADAVHNIFELLKQLALSLSPAATTASS